MTEKILLCDLSLKGQIRAALWDERRGLSDARTIAVANADEFEAGILAFLDDQGAPFLRAAALAAPGWEHEGVQHMPNHGYDLDREWLRKVFNVQRIHIVNPTVARAMAIPSLPPEDCDVISAGDDNPDQTKCIIGTGPGLGMAMLIQDAFGQWTAFCGAAGHSDLATETQREQAVLPILMDKYGHVSRERAVSLGGIVDIRDALAQIDGVPEPAPASAAEIVTLADGGDALAKEAVDMCVTFLARAASDMALITGARGGVYLTGELVTLLDRHIDRDRFRRDFTDKGRLAGYLEATPVYGLKTPDVEFNGLATLFA